MSNGKKDAKCTMGCWVAAALAGLLTLILLMAGSSWTFLGALFVAALVFVFMGLLLSWILCKPASDSAGHGAHSAARTVGGAVAGAAGAAAGVASAAGSSVKGAATAAAETAKDAAGGAVDAAKDAAASAADTAAAVKDAAAEKVAGAAEATKDAAANAAAATKDAANTAASATTATAKAAADTASDATAAAKEAAGDAADAAKAKADAAAEEAKKAAATAKEAVADATPDYDGDGVFEGENEGKRPEALDGPRGGKADDLKQIKGIGPKLEKLCNSLGFYHFDQIAGWSADEIAWVNANLAGFKGRVTRDEWVSQAKTLAAGGETEFSKRVEGGKVY